MSWWQVLFLSFIQGVTEFLPVSSSGHLVLFQKIFGLRPPIFFDVLVHVGTLLAVVFFFRKELGRILKGFFKKEKESWHLLSLILIGTLPALVVGFLLNKNIERIFDSLFLVGIAFVITGGLLLSSRWFLKRAKKNFGSLKWLDALTVGFFQALAILPGVSRSGSTIVGGLFRKIKPEQAFQFSFFLAIPAILGALTLQIADLIKGEVVYLGQSILGMFIAGLVGYFSLKLLKKILINFQLWFLSFYCFLIAFFFLLFN